MKTTVVTPPVGEPVPLSAVKDYLRVGHEGEDALITELIAASRARLESETGLALVSRTVSFQLDTWPERFARQGIALPMRPATSLVEVALIDADGVREMVTSRFVLTDCRFCLAHSAFLPAISSGGSAEIVFEVGFGSPTDIPDDLQLAVKMLAGHSYRLREGGRETDEDALPADIDEILAPYRRVRL